MIDASAAVPSCSRRRKMLISLFLLFHFTCVLAATLPARWSPVGFLLSISIPLPERKDGVGWRVRPQSVVREYLLTTSQWQNWYLFAPDPIAVNRFLSAEVTFRNGSTRPFEFPRPARWGLVERHLQARIREYEHYAPMNDFLLADLARYVARHSNDPANPPVKVVLYQHQMYVPPHNRLEARETVDYGQLIRDESRYTRFPRFRYVVKPEDLW